MPFFITMPAEGGGFWIRFPYDPELVNRIKRLPTYARRWEPEMKAWWIDAGWFEVAKSFLDETASYSDFRRCDNGWRPDDEERDREMQERLRQSRERQEREDRERERERERERARAREQFRDWSSRMFGSYERQTFSNTAREDPTAACFAKLYLLPSAPPKLVTAAWRALSLLYHPDVGGSTEQMKEINVAYDQALKIAESRWPK